MMREEIAYRAALVLIATVQGLISRRYTKRAKAGGTLFQPRAEGRVLTVLTGAAFLAYCLTTFVYLANPGWMAWSALGLATGLRWSGAVVMALGASLHLWGMHHLGANLTMSISAREEATLITSGPYRWVRHPLYSGGMLESMGVCLLLSNGAVAMFALGFWALIAWRTPREEALLREAFGDAYERYRTRAGRFVPKIRIFE